MQEPIERLLFLMAVACDANAARLACGALVRTKGLGGVATVFFHDLYAKPNPLYDDVSDGHGTRPTYTGKNTVTPL